MANLRMAIPPPLVVVFAAQEPLVIAAHQVLIVPRLQDRMYAVGTGASDEPSGPTFRLEPDAALTAFDRRRRPRSSHPVY